MVDKQSFVICAEGKGLIVYRTLENLIESPYNCSQIIQLTKAVFKFTLIFWYSDQKLFVSNLSI